MSKELDLVNHLDEVNKVASEYLKGADASEISRSLDIPRQRVMSLLNDWRRMAANNEATGATNLGGAIRSKSRHIAQ